MVGDKIFDAYWPDRLYNHDAEDRDEHGRRRRDRARRGARAQPPRRRERSPHLREPELRADERRLQVGRRRALRLQEPAPAPQPGIDPRVATATWIRPSSQLAHDIERMGRLAHKKLNDLHASRRRSTTACSIRPLDFLMKNEDDLTGRERALLEGARRVDRQAAAAGAPGDFRPLSGALRHDRRLGGRRRGGARARHREELRAVLRADRRARPTCWSSACRTSARTTCTRS